ncbi:hypothetical protein D3C77_273930 [compost metagenome]
MIDAPVVANSCLTLLGANKYPQRHGGVLKRNAKLAILLGSVRKEMSQTPHGTSQRDHSGIAFRELVEACHDPAVLFQPAKHALDDVALSVLGPIEQSG